MKDLAQYSDDELSLQVFNDEYFYIERLNPEFLMAIIQEEFLYTEEQMTVLIQDLEQDLDEALLAELGE